MEKITGIDIHDMVRHWLSTPVNGYLGSSHGQDIKALLQNPLAAGEADGVLQKLRTDVPILAVLPDGAVNLYGVQSAPDRIDLVIEVARQAVEVGGA